MAQRFLVCAAPDLHIDFLGRHPGAVHAYLDGTHPAASEVPPPLPGWWPGQPPKLLASWSVNYRNADLYHWILNGGPDLVNSGGAIFQSWYEPNHADAYVKLDDSNERFAFRSAHIGALSSLVSAVTLKFVLDAFIAWCKSQGKEWEDIDDYACEPFVVEFKAFGVLLGEAMRNRQGIIW